MAKFPSDLFFKRPLVVEDNGGGAAFQGQKVEEFLAAGPGTRLGRFLIPAALQLQEIAVIRRDFPAITGGWIGRGG